MSLKRLSVLLVILALCDCLTLLLFPREEINPLALWFLQFPMGAWLAALTKMAGVTGVIWTTQQLRLRWPLLVLSVLYSVVVAWDTFAIIHNLLSGVH